MKSRSIVLLSLVTGACAGASAGVDVLQVGRFVEAKGRVDGDGFHVAEIDAVERGPDDKSDKVEVTGPVTTADARGMELLGHAFVREADTEFEDVDRQPIAPFVPAVGDWLRVKARHRGDELRARTLRRMEPRDQFKVTGEVHAIDFGGGTIDVGGIRLPLAQDVDLGSLRRRDANDPLSLFLADDQKAVPFGLRLGESLLLGGQASVEYEYDDEFDLDAGRDRDRAKPGVRGKLDALWLIDEAGSYALAEVTFGRDDTIRENDVDTHEDQLELSRAFASVTVTEQVQLLVGRQDFDEQREWLYDEVLDGARAVLHAGDFEVELGGAVGREIGAEQNDHEDTGLLIANLRTRVDRDWELAAYALRRTDDTGNGFEPLLYGLRSFAFPRHGLGHWFEFGLAAGDDGTRPIRGHAVDLGLLYAFDTAWRPTLGLGFASASGERESASEVGYRQSGQQDNNGKLGGVTSVRYYGELLDPELANLSVTTLCAAVRPIHGASVSLLFHTYRQDQASTALPDTDLRVQPTGIAREIGSELDLVIGYRLARRMTVELVAAHFDPGSAFAGDASATLFAITARLSY